MNFEKKMLSVFLVRRVLHALKSAKANSQLKEGGPRRPPDAQMSIFRTSPARLITHEPVLALSQHQGRCPAHFGPSLMSYLFLEDDLDPKPSFDLDCYTRKKVYSLLHLKIEHVAVMVRT